ncbi:MAG TPA: radical SAM protein [Bacteroidales bacterium]|nr:radical SAM protein [Bacteroidales bacterium]
MFLQEDIKLLSDCTVCPRNCNADRFAGGAGWCRIDAGPNVASVCIHRGEEPVISGNDGICNVFFYGCNLRCVFCQNHEISQPAVNFKKAGQTFEEVIDTVAAILNQGINSLGFVSPSHMIVQMTTIIRLIHDRGFKPVIVYNSNGFDKPEILRSLENIVDVYLPDLKYVTPALSSSLSGAAAYPETALKALKEMYFQKGSSLRLDDNGKAENGMLIRHLVLPGQAEESKNVLRKIAEELSTGVHISLMSQYYPAWKAVHMPPFDRSLYTAEYNEVVNEMHALGFRNGYVQDIESNITYRPDFGKDHPFE